MASSPLVEITLLHRAMRLELESMCALAETLAYGRNVGSVEAELLDLHRRYRDFDVVFSSHSSAEDDFIFPTLATRGSAPSFANMAREHEDEVVLMRAVEESLANASLGGGLEMLARRLRLLKETLSEHMLQEEEAIFPALASFSQAELSRLVGLVMGSRPSEVLEATIRMEVTHLEPDHARHVLSTMCSVAANTHFKDWLNVKFGAGAQQRQLQNQHANPSLPSSNPNPAKKKRCPRYGHTTLVVAPCCGVLVCCRHCHDEAKVCPVNMNSRAVSKMRCSSCETDQPLRESCFRCNSKISKYFCDVCKLIDDTEEPVYHCPYCNLCRRGFGLGVDHMHCMKCNLCVTLENMSTHPCGPDARAQAM